MSICDNLRYYNARRRASPKITIMIALKNLTSRLSQNSFISSVALIAGGTALGQAAVIAVSPILTRLYSPEDFGLLAAFVSVFSILVTMNSLRYELAIPLAESPARAANLIVLVLLLVIVTTVLFGVIFGLSGEALTQLINAPGLYPHLGLLLLSLLGAGFYQGLSYWGIRQNAVSLLARTRFMQNFGMAAAQLILGLVGLGIGGLLLGHAVGQIMGTLTLARLAWRENRDHLRSVTPGSLLDAARRYRRFPLYASWSGALNIASIQLPALLLISLYGADVAGWFSLGQRVIGLPMALVGTAVGQVYLSRASQLAREKPDALSAFFSKTAQRLFLIALLPIIALALVSPPAFSFVFGENWRAAGEFLQIMAPMFLIQFVVSSLSQTIFVVERQDLQLLYDVMRTGLIVLIFVIAGLLHFTPIVTIAFYSAAMFVLYILHILMNRYAIGRYLAVTGNV